LYFWFSAVLFVLIRLRIYTPTLLLDPNVYQETSTRDLVIALKASFDFDQNYKAHNNLIILLS